MSSEHPYVYLDFEAKIRSIDLPHSKVYISGTAYYFAESPVGDMFVHEANPRDRHGYGGDTINFLLKDGRIESVTGPYNRNGAYDYGAHQRLFEATGDERFLRVANRITVGRNLSIYGTNQEVVHEEPEWHLTDWTERCKPEWAGLDVRVHVRGGFTTKRVP